MIKRLLSLLIFLTLSLSTYASHIVGGEFELLHISGTSYQLNLILYFDVINGNPGAQDGNALTRIFRKSDNTPMFDVNIPFISQTRVEYFQPICSSGEVITDRLLYSTTINLPAENFNDPEGYYISWERCCRNYTINNIFSDDPANAGGIHAGQTFYLEFPPVVDENGDEFINSSPQLFPPLNDFACPNRTYWVDFAGTDVDGDSLSYTLVTPLSTFNPVALPVDGPGAGPYNTVTWREDLGFGVNNIMNGDPDLEISPKGFLTVTPTQEGLFVFAVKCQEFRNGVKIGELIRDFQMLVLDGCPIADPPVVRGKSISEGSYSNANFIERTFQNTTSDAARCIDIQISDLDANKIEYGFEENISFKVIALNFDPTDDELAVILPSKTEAKLTMTTPEKFQICFPECPFIDPQESDFFDIGVVAFDDACTLPLSDTLTIRVRVIPPTNNPPVILSSGNDVPALVRTEVQGAGKSLSIPLQGKDIDGHNMMMQINTVEEFDLAKAGMNFSYFPTGEFESGPINTTFTWNLDCNDSGLDFSEGLTVSPDGAEVVKQYKFEILLEDEDDCDYSREDKLEMELNIKFPDEFEPNVYQVGQSKLLESLRNEANLGTIINLDIEAKDGGTDTDNVSLTAIGSNFNLEDYGATFEDKTNQAGTITTPFTWSLDCDKFKLNEIDSFRVFFITQDIDACNLSNKDTLTIDFVIDTLVNLSPYLEFISPMVANNKVTTDIREEVSINVLGIDPDLDSTFLELLAVDGDKKISDFEFEPAKGLGSVSSTLTWTPDCENLNKLEPGNYRFTFLLTDGRCPNPATDTLSLDVEVNDIFNDPQLFIPPNVFTPDNGDDKNPYFGMYKIVDGQEVTILPIDNCEGVFQNITIVNRWGKEVYKSIDRDFRWLGEGEAAGVYFYQIKFSHTTFKGTVSILF
jgi:hypothetical protein